MDPQNLAWALKSVAEDRDVVRSCFAAMAMQGMLSNPQRDSDSFAPWYQTPDDEVAKAAVSYADALLTELAKPSQSTVEADERAIRGALRAEFVRGLAHAAAIVRSDKPNSKAEVLLGKLSDRAEEMSPELAGLFADFAIAWADDAAETAAAIEAVKDGP